MDFPTLPRGRVCASDAALRDKITLWPPTKLVCYKAYRHLRPWPDGRCTGVLARALVHRPSAIDRCGPSARKRSLDSNHVGR
jgi:hypothetical protein